MLVEIMPTLRCNLSCPGCDRGVGSGPSQDIGDMESTDIIKDVVQVLDTDVRFVISGGEPTLYSKLPNLLLFLRKYTNSPIEIKTNGFRLLDIPAGHLLANHWSISVYEESLEYIRKSGFLLNRLSSIGVCSLSKVEWFDDLDNVGTEWAGLSPMDHCFIPTIIGSDREIYPCCRAMAIGLRSGDRFSVPVERFSIEALSKIVTDTALCRYCPRFMGSSKISRQKVCK